MNNNSKPADLLDKLVSNHNAGQPLLEGVKLYRGTRLPDQALGHFGKELHASLLPQVAARYTHNWKAGGQAYIGTYPIDRDTTKFYADFGMEKTGGAAPKAYSVADVEKALAPLVNNLATAKTPQDKTKAEQHIESLLKTSFYEAGVPAKAASGEATRPQTLYAYDGRPDTSMRRAVTMQMSEMSPAHEKTARLQMLTEHKSPAMQKMVEMLATRTQASPAIAVLVSVAARDHSKDLMNAHATKPLGELIQGISNQPPSAMQERLGKFAHALQAGVMSSNPATQQKAVLLSSEIAKLNPDKATYADLAAVSGAVNARTAGNQPGVTRQPTAGTAQSADGTSISHSSESGRTLGRTARQDFGGGGGAPGQGASHSTNAGRELGGSFGPSAGHFSNSSRSIGAQRGSLDVGGVFEPAAGRASTGISHNTSQLSGIHISGGSRGASGSPDLRTLGEQVGRSAPQAQPGTELSQGHASTRQAKQLNAPGTEHQSSGMAAQKPQASSRSMDR